MHTVFIRLNREYCNQVMVAYQCELFLQICGSLSSLILFTGHLQNICSVHSNVNSSEYPLLLSRVSYSSFCSNYMHLSESPVLCKTLVSSVILQFTLGHNK